jgi:hypothetical protein
VNINGRIMKDMETRSCASFLLFSDIGIHTGYRICPKYVIKNLKRLSCCRDQTEDGTTPKLVSDRQ